MLKLGACPRCHGDLHSNRDLYGSYNQCLQCGYMRDIPEVSRLLEALRAADLKKKVA